ncbi:hypothetical protein GTW66_14890 [Streptomyces sp. SID5473]|uniref:hypothetical protein n=1 Tax=Streptomyces sp. SID5473 TaxID=2690299 RepID=UPI0002E010AD|nr:hypothetical protein [Streptomyces sp. SID5473]MYS65297.1 hypothetical protein [Streptomyces sp. SID5473]
MEKPIRVGAQRRRGRGTAVTGLVAAVAVLALTASGCVTVHGERAVVPSATKAEAARALKEFVTAFNAADKAYDPALDAGRVTGALGAVNQAGMKSRSVTYPGGNPRHVPLELTDVTYSIPKKAGWPRYFLADADPNRDRDGGPRDERWLLVFLRGGPTDVWKAGYLNAVPAAKAPKLKRDGDGHVSMLPASTEKLAQRPDGLPKSYSSYMQSGTPPVFGDGPHSSQWRDSRRRTSNLPGISTQWIDQPLDTGDFAPLAFAAQDGGALVFFTIRTYERQTAAGGVKLPVHPDVKPLLTGEVKTSLTKERVSAQAVLVPAAGGGAAAKTEILSRLAGLTTALAS